MKKWGATLNNMVAENIPLEPDLFNYNEGKMKNNLENFVDDCLAVRNSSPLVLCMTNYVAMNITANALLAIGASPLMSSCQEEMEDVVAGCSSICINIGCIDHEQLRAMKTALNASKQNQVPWILDPVGVGVSRYRMQACMDLLAIRPPTIIRGNASEIMTLAGMSVSVLGVDSQETVETACEAALMLAKRYETAVVVSGSADFITDGKKKIKITNGSLIMKKVTAMGCVSSAIAATFSAIDGDGFCSATNAMALMGIAGERSAANAMGSGSFQKCFIDELYNCDPQFFFKDIKSIIV